MKRFFHTALILMAVAVVRADACAACFGKTDAPLARGMNAGIFTMLAVVAGAWILFGSFFVFIARRAKRVNSESAADNVTTDT